MSHFSLKSKLKAAELPLGHKIEESDFAFMTPEGMFVQLEHIETEDETTSYEVKPGIFTIVKNVGGLKLEKTSFTNDDILDKFVSTKEIEDNIESFFNNLNVYYEHGIEVPKHSILIHGPAGTGKSTCITKVSNKYTQDGKTLVIIWNTDKFEAYQVKDFIKSFKYTEVEKVILVAEDLGGIEMDQVKFKSDSSLLSLLDNKEKTFTLPVLILSTTNFPEAFLGNLTNRPERFDDKIEVTYPVADARVELFRFFCRSEITQETIDLIKSDKCKEFTPAHIRQVIMRAATRRKNHKEIILQILKEIEYYKSAFTKRNGLGMGVYE